MKRPVLILLIISTLLSGCVAAVVAGAAAGLIVYDRRSISTLESDARIFHVIHKNIVTNPRFKNARIVVVSFNQVVLLLGQATSADLKTSAERIAKRTANVRRVYNEISISYPIPINVQTNDSWITSQVRTRMLQRKGLESGSIRVVTENSVVYLIGIALPEQADIAVEEARQVAGVKKVVKVFQYIT